MEFSVGSLRREDTGVYVTVSARPEVNGLDSISVRLILDRDGEPQPEYSTITVSSQHAAQITALEVLTAVRRFIGNNRDAVISLLEAK